MTKVIILNGTLAKITIFPPTQQKQTYKTTVVLETRLCFTSTCMLIYLSVRDFMCFYAHLMCRFGAIYIIKGVMFVCLYLCSVWPAKRLGRSRPNLTHALMTTQGVFLSRSMSRSFMYACVSDRITKHPVRCTKATPGERCSNYVRRTGEATPGERLRNSVRTTGNY